MEWRDWYLMSEVQLWLLAFDIAPLSQSHGKKPVLLCLRGPYFIFSPALLLWVWLLVSWACIIVHNRNQSDTLLNWHLCLSIQLSPYYLQHVPNFLLLLPAGWVGSVDSMCFKWIYLYLLSEYCYSRELCAAFQGSFLIAIFVSNSVICIQIKLTCIAIRCTADVLSTLLKPLNKFILHKYFHTLEWIHNIWFLSSQQYLSCWNSHSFSLFPPML